jgi:hypothetical protein
MSSSVLLLVAAALLPVAVLVFARSRGKGAGASVLPEPRWIPPTLPECADSQYLEVQRLNEPGPCSPVVPAHSSWRGIALNGPKAVSLPPLDAPQRSFTAQAVVSVLTRLPAGLEPQLERMMLVFEDIASGERRQNAVRTLTQPNGLSISWAMPVYPGGPPKHVTVTEALLREETADGPVVGTWVQPNISLLGFPGPPRRYRCWAELDEVRSNVIELEVGHPPA